MFLTFKALSKKDAQTFYDSFESIKNIGSSNQYVWELFEVNNNRITIYHTLAVTVEGYNLDLLIANNLVKHLMDKKLYIGSDEVGVGEPLGPIVVCGVGFANNTAKEKVFLQGIVDSKKFNYDRIMKIGQFLEVNTINKCVIIPPRSFNEQYAKGVNTKLLNAVLHNRIHLELGTKLKYPSIIDAFVGEKKYNEYLALTNETIYPTDTITFEQKAENKYIEVAAAAILAKYKFNLFVEKQLKANNINPNTYINKNMNYRQIIDELNKKIIKIEPLDDFVKKWN